MLRVLVESSLLYSLLFLVANMLVLLIVLILNRWHPRRSASAEPPDDLDATSKRELEASQILGLEFEYARTTASEAMGERHTMVNFYLLAAGIVISGVVAALSGDRPLPSQVGTLLLWSLCVLGWVYFLGIIRLRQAWHDSARAMNQIKGFYFGHAEKFSSRELREAFRWKPETLPPPDKPFTIFFYSCLLIALLNSVAFVVGGLLVGGSDATSGTDLGMVLSTFALGVLLLGFHIFLYFAFLKPTNPGPNQKRTKA